MGSNLAVDASLLILSAKWRREDVYKCVCVCVCVKCEGINGKGRVTKHFQRGLSITPACII